VLNCLERAGEFDIIHNHTSLEGLATAGFVDTPVLSTLHGGMDGDWRLLFERYRGWYNTISGSAKRLLPPKEGFAGVVYNGIDYASYPFNPGDREDHLLYLSRINPEKGPHLAIEVARRLGKRLLMAGNIHSVDREYFRREVEPHIDGDLVRYIGEADQATKRRLLSQASCLLAPITWDEPFGLFMAESMACGTPVIAMDRGAAPEVVKHGETGFIVDSIDEMCRAVAWLHEIDPYACRRRVAEYFSVGSMVDNYLAAYRRVCESPLLWREEAAEATAPQGFDVLVPPPGQAVLKTN
jgi:glycosyltransferase involved in cell wall biosynthesis